MKLAAILNRPPWSSRHRWYAHRIRESFPSCTLITIADAGRAAWQLRRLYRKYGPLRVVPHLMAAMLYRRQTRRIERLAEARFDELTGEIEVASTDLSVAGLSDPVFLDWLDRTKPDVIVPIAGGIIHPDLLSRCTWIRYHHGVTPKIRGLASPYWAVHDQRPDWLGFTIQELIEKIDAGPILAQETLSAEQTDDLATVHFKLDLCVCDHLIEALKRVENGAARPVPCDPSQGTYRSNPTLGSLLRFPSRERRFFRAFGRK